MNEYKKQFVLNLLAYAVQRDVSPLHLCRLSGVDFKALKGKTGNPPTSKQFSDLWLNAIHLTGDPAFGLHFGESLQLSALGVVGQIIQSCNTVGEALTLAAKSLQLITDNVSMDVSRNKKSVSIEFFSNVQRNKDSSTIVSRHLLEFFMVFTIHEMDGLILEKIKPIKVRFNFDELVSLGEYERVLRCKPQLKKDGCTVEFESLLWDVPIITANYDLQRHLLELVRQKEKTTNETLMCDRITSYLMANSYLGIATLEDIASNFNVSPRTLQRKLKEEGSTFKQLSDSVRKSIALDYLRSGHHPVREISCMYNELSAFTRAFRRWTGITPVNYRKKKTHN